FARRLPLPTPNHAMTRPFTFLDLDVLISELQQTNCLSAPSERRDRTTEERTMRASFANDRNARRRPGSVSHHWGRTGRPHAPALQGRCAGAKPRVRREPSPEEPSLSCMKIPEINV